MFTVQKRSAFFVQRSVLFALFLRELKTRFETPMEYVWAILAPLIQILIFVAIFWVMGRKSRVESIPFPLFLVTGIVPFFFFRICINRAMSTIQRNAGLFFYRQVKPIDTIIATLFLELLVYATVYLVLLLAFAFFGYSITVSEPFKLIMVYLAFVMLTFCVGLNLAVANFHFPIIRQAFKFLARILYFVSGVLIPISMIPSKFRMYLLYNPIVHVMEISRDAFFEGYSSEYGDWSYLLVSTLVLFVTGMALYRTNRFALLNPTT